MAVYPTTPVYNYGSHKRRRNDDVSDGAKLKRVKRVTCDKDESLTSSFVIAKPYSIGQQTGQIRPVSEASKKAKEENARPDLESNIIYHPAIYEDRQTSAYEKFLTPCSRVKLKRVERQSRGSTVPPCPSSLRVSITAADVARVDSVPPKPVNIDDEMVGDISDQFRRQAFQNVLRKKWPEAYQDVDIDDDLNASNFDWKHSQDDELYCTDSDESFYDLFECEAVDDNADPWRPRMFFDDSDEFELFEQEVEEACRAYNEPAYETGPPELHAYF